MSKFIISTSDYEGLTYFLKSRKFSVLRPSVVPDCLRLCGLEPARFLCQWNSPGKNTGGGCHFQWGIQPMSLKSPALAGGFFTTSTTEDSSTWAWSSLAGKNVVCVIISYNDYNSQLKSVKVAQSCLTLYDPEDYTATPRTIQCMEFSRPEYWRG